MTAGATGQAERVILRSEESLLCSCLMYSHGGSRSVTQMGDRHAPWHAQQSTLLQWLLFLHFQHFRFMHQQVAVTEIKIILIQWELSELQQNYFMMKKKLWFSKKKKKGCALSSDSSDNVSNQNVSSTSKKWRFPWHTLQTSLQLVLPYLKATRKATL